MSNDLPNADATSPWMSHLERAHDFAHVAARTIEDEAEPSAHAAPAAQKLARGIAALYDAFDGRADRPTAIGIAHAHLWDAAILVTRAGLPRALVALRGACAELVSAEERFPRVPLRGRVPSKLCAGVDVPPFHTIERASLMPAFRTPPLPPPDAMPPIPELPAPKTFEELAAAVEAVKNMVAERMKALPPPVAIKRLGARAAIVEVPPGFALAPPAQLSEDEFVRRWARECVDEIGMLGLQRTPLLGDDWRASYSLEKRLVGAIDAIAALGSAAIHSVEPLAMDAPAADPMRVFAVAMIGGCLEGRDALASAERVLHRFGAGDPPVADAFISAMKLAQNPFVPSAMRQLMALPDKAARRIGVEVLAYRGWLTPKELGELVEDEDPHLFAESLSALATLRHPDLPRALARANAHSDIRVKDAALDAMAMACHTKAASTARDATTGGLGERAMVKLAIVGDEDDARWLLERMRAAPTAGVVEAVGWSGLVDAVPALLHLLDEGEDEVKLAAGAALDRLLGAKLVDEIDIFPEALDDTPVVDPDPDAKPKRKTLAELVSDPRDLPPPGSKETLEVPSKDPERWRAYWAEHGRNYDPKQRIRRGQPYSPSVSLYELDRLPLTPKDRRLLQLELAARTGKITHFDPHDFVAVQEQCLRAWAGIVAASNVVAGSWARPIGM